ncbi:MAG: HNH endonuclease [Myxococcota bacterium]
MWRSWRGACEAGRAYREPLLRDRYRCSSPVCERRDMTPHHIVFRSQGGGDEDENIAGLCSACHLDGVHGGVLRIRGRAPRLTRKVGREPVLVVRGREVVRRAA